MITIEINKYLTLAIAVGVLMLGQFLRKRIRFLETFCIPAGFTWSLWCSLFQSP